MKEKHGNSKYSFKYRTLFGSNLKSTCHNSLIHTLVCFLCFLASNNWKKKSIEISFQGDIHSLPATFNCDQWCTWFWILLLIIRLVHYTKKCQNSHHISRFDKIKTNMEKTLISNYLEYWGLYFWKWLTYKISNLAFLLS